MRNTTEQSVTPNRVGAVIHWAARYDLLLGLISGGKERAYRESTLDLARLKAGESALDVGCGTGTLAIAAKRRVGPAGKIHGIDASPEMIARARKKAARASVDVGFENAAAQKLPFGDGTFDVVLSITMLHHLSVEGRRQCFREVRRVLKPGGRFLAVDFGGPARTRRSWIARFHRHGRIDLQQLDPLLSEAGLNGIENGAVDQSVGLVSDLHYVLAEASA